MGGMQGFGMMFPVIRVQDEDTGRVHVVGTNSHDALYIDDETNGIQYLNLKFSEGTKYGGFKFKGKENELSPGDVIEFVSIDELLDIYKAHMDISADDEKKIREFALRARERDEEEVRKSREAGIWHT